MYEKVGFTECTSICNFSCHKEKKRNCETHYNIVSNFEKCVVFIFADDTAEGKGKRERPVKDKVCNDYREFVSMILWRGCENDILSEGSKKRKEKKKYGGQENKSKAARGGVMMWCQIDTSVEPSKCFFLLWVVL